VKWIIDQHRGIIHVESRPDRGTRFRIHFPER
jgi:signal transduction histidine kinase